MLGNKKRDNAIKMLLGNMYKMARCDDAMPRHVILQNCIRDLGDQQLLPEVEELALYMERFDR